jgi:mismatch-specific thymine-DNA glycosylase
MSNYKTRITINNKSYDTLKDILPNTSKQIDILFIAKTPAIKSVELGHYFQGQHGQFFWNKLKNYNILKVKSGTFEDENLIENNYGITDIVKVPRNYGSEPTAEEYKIGLNRILNIIKKYRPKVIVFVYKRVLDNILKFGFDVSPKTEYGFNPKLKSYFKSNVFVFPMPGTPCTKEQGDNAMNDLTNLLKGSMPKNIKELNPIIKKESKAKIKKQNAISQPYNKHSVSFGHWLVWVFVIAIIIYIIGQIKYGN